MVILSYMVFVGLGMSKSVHLERVALGTSRQWGSWVGRWWGASVPGQNLWNNLGSEHHGNPAKGTQSRTCWWTLEMASWAGLIAPWCFFLGGCWKPNSWLFQHASTVFLEVDHQLWGWSTWHQWRPCISTACVKTAKTASARKTCSGFATW